MSYEITLTDAKNNEPYKLDVRLVAQLQQYGIYSAEMAEGKTNEELQAIEPKSLATMITFHCGCQFLAVEDIDVVDAMIMKAGTVVN